MMKRTKVFVGLALLVATIAGATNMDTLNLVPVFRLGAATPAAGSTPAINSLGTPVPGNQRQCVNCLPTNPCTPGTDFSDMSIARAERVSATPVWNCGGGSGGGSTPTPTPTGPTPTPTNTPTPGGGSSGAVHWDPDGSPLSPSALDDEFNDSAFNTSLWTEWDFGSKVAITEDSAGLLFTTTCATTILAGAYQPVPAGNFTIAAKVRFRDRHYTTYMGLALLQDGTSSSGDVFSFMVQRDGINTLNIYGFSYSAYNANSGTPLAVSETNAYSSRLLNTFYLRIRRTGTTYSFDFSVDGVSWEQEYTTSSLGFTPTHFGPLASCETSGTSLIGFEWFRYVASDVGAHGLTEGRQR